jgi:hypothetical protein
VEVYKTERAVIVMFITYSCWQLALAAMVSEGYKPARFRNRFHNSTLP